MLLAFLGVRQEVEMKGLYSCLVIGEFDHWRIATFIFCIFGFNFVGVCTHFKTIGLVLLFLESVLLSFLILREYFELSTNFAKVVNFV